MSGRSVNLLYRRVFSLGAGVFVLNGKSVNPTDKRILYAAAGSFALQGKSINTVQGGQRSIQIGKGTFNLSGDTMNIVPSPMNAYMLVCQPTVAFNVSGQSVLLNSSAKPVLQMGAGAFTLSGDTMNII